MAGNEYWTVVGARGFNPADTKTHIVLPAIVEAALSVA